MRDKARKASLYIFARAPSSFKGIRQRTNCRWHTGIFVMTFSTGILRQHYLLVAALAEAWNGNEERDTFP